MNAARPNKIAIGETCPICEQGITKQHARTHVVWHFIEELREIGPPWPQRGRSPNLSSAAVAVRLAGGPPSRPRRFACLRFARLLRSTAAAPAPRPLSAR